MNTYKRHRFRLGAPHTWAAPRLHFLCRLALLQIQSQPSPVCRTIQINGKQHYLWRAVNQDGEIVDAYLQAKRDGAIVTTRLPTGSSSGYCEVMEGSPGRS
jgi:hypothetical protein